MKDGERVKKILAILKKTYPKVTIALNYKTDLELLVAIILSAQCTDKKVNEVTPALFQKCPNALAFAKADLTMLEKMIRPTGFFKNKAKSIKNCCAILAEKYQGKVPKDFAKLIELPGVGRKSANAFLGNYYDVPGVVVDTHVIRIANLLGLTKNKDAVKIELDLQPLIPKKDWTKFSLLIQAHGRNICIARRPRCEVCPILKLCSFGNSILTKLG
ncbi:MAG: endonuclease III [Pseudomonadota bacterium]